MKIKTFLIPALVTLATLAVYDFVVKPSIKEAQS